MTLDESPSRLLTHTLIQQLCARQFAIQWILSPAIDSWCSLSDAIETPWYQRLYFAGLYSSCLLRATFSIEQKSAATLLIHVHFMSGDDKWHITSRASFRNRQSISINSSKNVNLTLLLEVLWRVVKITKLHTLIQLPLHNSQSCPGLCFSIQSLQAVL